ncbi:MAG: hypothetical protein SV186_02500 [Candidatus Nanohaloarchaea archaeon]|nr:hypothetical protein [Candidatus Nanohaloarchaea archaeon]
MEFTRQHAGGLLVGALLILSLGAALQSGTTYEKFNLERTTVNGSTVMCEQYYAACTCYGDLLVMESYPPQYRCQGIEHCRPVNRTSCR